MNSEDSPFASRRESPGIAASPIDRAIDQAVRKMMRVDPPAGLRRRVMARIEAGPGTRGFLGSLRIGPPSRSIVVPAFAVAAALAILVLGVIATRNNGLPPSSADAPAVAVAEKAPAGGSRVARAMPDAAPAPRPPRVATPRRAGFRREPIPMAPVADIFGTRETSIAAASDPTADAVWTAPAAAGIDDSVAAPAPLVVRPVGVPPIDTPPIVIAPLAVGRPPAAPSGPPR
jgi:hypothetical protein